MIRLPHRATEDEGQRAKHEDVYYRSLVSIFKGGDVVHADLARARAALGIPVEKFAADLDVLDRSNILRRSEGA